MSRVLGTTGIGCGGWWWVWVWGVVGEVYTLVGLLGVLTVRGNELGKTGRGGIIGLVGGLLLSVSVGEFFVLGVN